MQIEYLINPRGTVSAELIRDEKVTISEPWILESISRNGITVDTGFKERHQTGWRVYPTDDSAVFAIAFEKIYFVHGLQQMGFYWASEPPTKQSSAVIAKMLIALHNES